MRTSTIGSFVMSFALLLGACAAPQRATLGSAPTPTPMPAPLPASPIPAASVPSCESGAFDAVTVHERAAASIVRVATENGSGSGFVVSDGETELVVTNHHVVASGNRHSAEVPSVSGGEPLRVALEVVKIDPEEDLALLRPRSSLGVKSLELRTVPARIGESVAALGYPGIAGSKSELTLEPGTVTAAKRKLQGAARVQTNASINPGNSGGPLLDGCGRIVAVVSAKHTRAERVGIAVPAAALARLIAAQRAPKLAPEAAVGARLEQFLREVRFRRADRVAAFFGREFLQREVVPAYDRLLKSAKGKAETFIEELRGRGERVSKLSPVQAKELLERLSKNEREALQIQAAVTGANADAITTARKLFELNATDLFGEVVEDAAVESVQATASGCVEAYLTVRGNGQVRRYILHVHERWGEWVIDGVERASR